MTIIISPLLGKKKVLGNFGNKKSFRSFEADLSIAG